MSAQLSSKVTLVGISGGAASGKSTLARLLLEYLGEQKCVVINSDDYYLPQDHIPPELRGLNNYDHPTSLELDLLALHLRSLKRGESINCPAYDFSQHTRKKDQYRLVLSRSIVIVDGALIFAVPALREQFDVMVFVDVPDSIRYQRRLSRDMRERGRTESDIEHQWNDTVQPMFEEFCQPSKIFADIVLDGVSLTTDSIPLIWGAIVAKIT